MKQTQLFIKTQKNTPHDEISSSSILLSRAGFIDKLMSGVYTYLPLGFLVYKNIENIIRQQMLEIGAKELLMPTLTPKNIWEQTGRWDSFTDLYKLKDASQKDLALAATHEEVIVPLVKKFVNSYKDLPLGLFQIQNKFRSELRAKSGLIRGREFIMKDLYSFHQDEIDLDNYYQTCIKSYWKIFEETGISKSTYLTIASGGTFSEFSHEFQAISPAGEDDIYLCKKCKFAVNQEIYDKYSTCSKCGEKLTELTRGIEVGNIFKLMDKYSQPFDLTYQDKLGKKKIILMGCYGIGLSRLMATIVEINHDKNGIIWPKKLTPYQVHLLDLENSTLAEKIYVELQKNNFTVLLDDRKANIGEKLNDADLLGCSVRLISSKKNGQKVEIKYRDQKNIKISGLKEIISELKNYYYN